MVEKEPNVFDIRYIKLHFTIEFLEDTVVPMHKVSALRGGMGEMLLRANCIRDRDCDHCDFESECIVRRTMYSKMEIQPTFMSSGDSIGYVIECEDEQEEFYAGDQLEFNLILFGKTLVYFSQYMNAFYTLGINGIGNNNSKFVIVSVTNTLGKPILNKSDINMANYEIMTVKDYIRYRQQYILRHKKNIYTIKFKSPLSIKYRGNQLRHFDARAIIESVCRRIYALDCFEGIESSIHELEYIETIQIPEITHQLHKDVSIRRYSMHKNSSMYLKGIIGEIEISNVSDELMELLIAGEVIHIGKNTSFGFGRYRIV